MNKFTITEVPVYDSTGKRVGTDKIRKYIVPPVEVAIPDGHVRVICSCGEVHENIPEIDFQSWPVGTLQNCACSLKV